MGQLTSQPVAATSMDTSSSGSSAGATIQSFAPATGELLGEAPIMGPEEVRAVVRRARRAQEAWGALPVEERCERVLRFRDAFIERQDELVELLTKECGKPKQEALLHEVATAASVATHFAKVAPELLAPRPVPLSLLKHRKSTLVYAPRGVVGVISPWNYPLQLPLRDVLMAVISGNAAVLKPSEVTPLIALAVKDIWDSAGLPEDVFQVVTGLGQTGAALIDSGIQFLVFTGGVATGRRVAAACGERLIPCVMELGGKAPLIACADADIERTAQAIVFGGFTNAGQACIAVERVYAHREIHDRLLDRVVELTKKLRVGDPARDTVDVGAIIFSRQMEVAETQIADALAKGAKLQCGGRRLDDRAGDFFAPTVLSDCDHSMAVMTEETFGPVVPFMLVGSDEEAIRLANESHLALNAYVFTRDRDYGARLAERIQAGSILVNDVITNGGLPEAPFGGMKQSGFGRVMGDESLREMCDVRHVNVDRIHTAKEPIWFPYTEKGYSVFRRTTKLLFSGGGPLKKLIELF